MFEECELKPITDIGKNNHCSFSGTDNIGERRCGLIKGENRIAIMKRCPLPDYRKKKGRNR
tara:strand:- start:400 stop:582 length:183 start_codon:yes stop_codon:yes gene_type:complete